MISVIIPTYNRASLLSRAMESVLGQTWKDLEVIVVDDASQDDTAQVVAACTDPRVRYIRLEKNSGACVARNTGVAEARGEWIAFQDSDDLWLPEKLEKQMAYLVQTGADVVFCAFDRYSVEGKKLRTFPHEHISAGRISYEQLLYENLISTQTILGRRECFLQEPFRPDFPRLQDWELMLRIVQRFYVNYEKSVYVRLYEQEDSISRQPEKAVAALHLLCGMHREAIVRSDVLLRRMLLALETAYGDCGMPVWPLYLKALSLRNGWQTNLYLIRRAGGNAARRLHLKKETEKR